MLLVGSFEPFDEAEARRVGADDHLTKPFHSIRQLVTRVVALLGRESAEDEARQKPLFTGKRRPAAAPPASVMSEADLDARPPIRPTFKPDARGTEERQAKSGRAPRSFAHRYFQEDD